MFLDSPKRACLFPNIFKGSYSNMNVKPLAFLLLHCCSCQLIPKFDKSICLILFDCQFYIILHINSFNVALFCFGWFCFLCAYGVVLFCFFLGGGLFFFLMWNSSLYCEMLGYPTEVSFITHFIVCPPSQWRSSFRPPHFSLDLFLPMISFLRV